MTSDMVFLLAALVLCATGHWIAGLICMLICLRLTI